MNRLAFSGLAALVALAVIVSAYRSSDREVAKPASVPSLAEIFRPNLVPQFDAVTSSSPLGGAPDAQSETEVGNEPYTPVAGIGDPGGVRGASESSRDADVSSADGSLPPGIEPVRAPPPAVWDPVTAPELAQELTREQTDALADISDVLVERVAHSAAASMSDDAPDEILEAEQSDTDSLYRILFGDSAYLQASMDAAVNKLRQGPSNSPSP